MQNRLQELKSKVGVSLFPRTQCLATPDMRKANGNISLVTPGYKANRYVTLSVLLRDMGAQSCNDVCREDCHRM